MRSLATELRSAVMQILADTYGYNNLTDEDFAFLGVVSTYADSREAGGPIASEALLKALRDTPRERVGFVPKGDTGPVGFNRGETGPVELPTKAPDSPFDWTAAPSNTAFSRALGGVPSAPAPEDTDQADLPLGTMDRGPDPQDVETLLTTKPPVAPAESELPPIDPSDPPPDYTRLETAATRRIDS